MSKTKIPWADEVLNPVVGCSPCSPGCKNCYAAPIAHRLGQNPATPQYKGLTRLGANGPEWTGEQRWLLNSGDWREAIKKRLAKMRPGTVVFVGSMADVFCDFIPREWGLLGAMMHRAPHVEFVLVSKRAVNLAAFAELTAKKANGPLPNVTGVATCCTQAEANHNIPLLLNAPFARHGVCLEPLLERVDLTLDGLSCWPCLHCANGEYQEWDTGANACPYCEGTGKSGEVGLDWVVTGCESGKFRRHAEPDWFRSLRDECVEACVPFMLKQMEVAGRVVEMPVLDGKVWGQTPWGDRP